MNNFNKAFEYLMSNETMLGKNGQVISHYEDPATGEISNWGASLAWLKTVDPEATADTIRGLTRDAAHDLYEKYWWEKYKLDQLSSDNVAAKMLDICVNCGPVTGIKMLQEALNEPLTDASEHLILDGIIGPKLIAAEAIDTETQSGEYGLLAAIVSLLEDHYQAIVAKNPAQQKNLKTWLTRAERLPS